MPVVLPHGNQVLGADDQGLPALVLLEEEGDGGTHHGLAQAYHVADHRPASYQHDPGGDLDGRLLELEQLAGHGGRQAEADQPLPSLSGQVIGHL